MDNIFFLFIFPILLLIQKVIQYRETGAGLDIQQAPLFIFWVFWRDS